jgi:hypothetical protein
MGDYQLLEGKEKVCHRTIFKRALLPFEQVEIFLRNFSGHDIRKFLRYTLPIGFRVA